MQYYTPIGDKVLIKPFEQEVVKEEIGSKIIQHGGEIGDGTLVKAATVASPTVKGEVCRIGPGLYATETGVFMPTTLFKGDIVLIGKGSGLPMTLDIGNGREDFLLLRETDILIFVERPVS